MYILDSTIESNPVRNFWDFQMVQAGLYSDFRRLTKIWIVCF